MFICVIFCISFISFRRRLGRILSTSFGVNLVNLIDIISGDPFRRRLGEFCQRRLRFSGDLSKQIKESAEPFPEVVQYFEEGCVVL